jgi:hypothetical protein
MSNGAIANSVSVSVFRKTTIASSSAGVKPRWCCSRLDRLRGFSREKKRSGNSPWPLHGLPTLDDIHHYHHDRDDKENVNESSQCEPGDQTDEPGENQNDRNGPEHLSAPPPVVRRQAIGKKLDLKCYAVE